MRVLFQPLQSPIGSYVSRLVLIKKVLSLKQSSEYHECVTDFRSEWLTVYVIVKAHTLIFAQSH